MKKKDEIEQTLTSIDQIERAEVGKDFEYLLLSEINRERESNKNKWLVSAMVAMILMALLNFSTLFLLPENTSSIEEVYLEELGQELLYQYENYLTNELEQ